MRYNNFAATAFPGARDASTPITLCDEDLTDGAGFDGSDASVDKLDGSGIYTVDIDSLLAELEADLGADFFGSGATGSATVTINPEDELSVIISDGTGRTLETVDALGNVTTATFDATGSQLSLRDPNSIGWNATYDARNRAVSMADSPRNSRPRACR